MRLRHGGLGAVVDVVAQMLAVGDLGLGAVDVLDAVAVDQEKVIRARSSGDVDVLAQLYGAFRADEEQSPVAPGGQLVRREPVDADVAGGQGLLTRILNKKFHYHSEVIDPRGWVHIGEKGMTGRLVQAFKELGAFGKFEF